MNITIIGAGNIGTQFAVHCAEKLNQVIIYGSKPEKINKVLTIIDENNEVIHQGEIVLATNNEKKAFENAEVLFVTLPAYCMSDIANKILPYVRVGMKIGLIPGTGGGECAFKKCVEKGAILFGLQRVPGVARLVEYGKTVRGIGYRNELHVAALPCSETKKCADIIEGIFDKKCVALPNYLNLTLTPSNPVLHTTRLKTLYRDYEEGVIYDRVSMFYEEWDDETSKLLLECDDEVQMICKRLEQFDLSYVKSLRIHYESFTAEEMTKKISSIEGFKGLTSPMVRKNEGYIPDFSSRYFKADFPYGLSILVQIADLIGVAVPNMKETLDWYYSLEKGIKGFRFCDYKIESFEDFVSFYAM